MNLCEVKCSVEYAPDGTIARKEVVDKDTGEIELKKIVHKTPSTGDRLTLRAGKEVKTEGNATAVLLGEVRNHDSVFVLDFDTQDNPLMSELQELEPTYTVKTVNGYHLYYKFIPNICTAALGGKIKKLDVLFNAISFCPPTGGYKKIGDMPIAEFSEQHKDTYRKYLPKKSSTTTASIDYKMPLVNIKDSVESIASLYLRLGSGDWDSGRDGYLLSAGESLMIYFSNDEPKRQEIIRKINDNFSQPWASEDDFTRLFKQSRNFIEANPLIKISKVDKMAQTLRKEEQVDVIEQYNERKNKYIEKIKNGDKYLGLATGYKAYDEVTEGLEEGMIYVVAAPSSVGKTMFAMNVMYNVAQSGAKVVAYSLEMSMLQMYQRFMGIYAEVFARDIIKNTTDRNLLDLEKRFEKKWRGMNIEIVDKIYNHEKIIDDIVERKERGEIELAVVDYAQNITSDKPISEYQLLSTACKDLQRVAIVCDIPVMLASQVTKGFESSDTATSGAKGTGSFYEVADNYIELTRDRNEDVSVTEMIVHLKKQRHGKSNIKIPLAYHLSSGKIHSLGDDNLFS